MTTQRVLPMYKICVSDMCNLLNELNEVDPLLVQHTVNTLWKSAVMHPEVEYIASADSYMTSMVGIINGALRPQGVRIAVNTVNGSFIFVPEQLETPDVTDPEEA